MTQTQTLINEKLGTRAAEFIATLGTGSVERIMAHGASVKQEGTCAVIDLGGALMACLDGETAEAYEAELVDRMQRRINQFLDPKPKPRRRREAVSGRATKPTWCFSCGGIHAGGVGDNCGD